MQNSKLERPKNRADWGTSIKESKKKITHSVHKKIIFNPSFFGITTWFGIEGWVWKDFGWMEAVQSVCDPGIICFSLPWSIPLNLSVSKCKQTNWSISLVSFFFQPPRLVLGTCVCIYTPLKFCATQMWTTDFCFRGSPDAAAAGAISCVTRTHRHQGNYPVATAFLTSCLSSVSPFPPLLQS